MNILSNKTGYLAKESTIKKGWYLVPYYPEILVNCIGEVYNLKFKRIESQRDWATTIGSYRTVAIPNGHNVTSSRLVHILICLAFHGIKPDLNHTQVNHIDGNKHNNIPSNLEWCTRTFNLIHAYKSGFRKDNREVISTNIITGEEFTYYSLGELGRELQFCSDGKVWRFIRNHKTIPFNNKTFRIKINKNSAPRKRIGQLDIIGKNYITNVIQIAPCYSDMELYTEINSGTILEHTRRKNLKLYKGWGFRFFKSNFTWPKFNDEEIKCSMFKTGSNYAIRVIDLETNTSSVHESIKSFARTINVADHIVKRAVIKTPEKYDKYSIVKI